MYLHCMRITWDDAHKDILLDLQDVVSTLQVSWLVLLWPCWWGEQWGQEGMGAQLARLWGFPLCIFEQPEHLSLRGSQRGFPYSGTIGWRRGSHDLWVCLRKITGHPKGGPFSSPVSSSQGEEQEKGNAPATIASRGLRAWPLHLSC